ncbi:MAG: ATP synthase F1 subunit epsilon [Actinobacteria bacterium]|nr:MAG: ATP synthase F1 subunit epsilon [Actinomycetota bacterium]
MARQLRARILTPEKVVYEGDVDMVVAPGMDGEIGLMPLHTPLVTPLKTGELRVKYGEEQDYIAIEGGYLEIREDICTVLADDAEIASEIDVARAEQLKAEAEREVAEAERGEGERAYEEARHHLDWALTQLRVAGKKA